MKIHIRTTNDAFQPEKGPELARILRELASRVERDGQPARREEWPVYDINGNRVGKVTA